MSTPPPYPRARNRIPLPTYRGELELRKASIARLTSVAFAAVIAATHRRSPGEGGEILGPGVPWRSAVTADPGTSLTPDAASPRGLVGTSSSVSATPVRIASLDARSRPAAAAPRRARLQCCDSSSRNPLER